MLSLQTGLSDGIITSRIQPPIRLDKPRGRLNGVVRSGKGEDTEERLILVQRLIDETNKLLGIGCGGIEIGR